MREIDEMDMLGFLKLRAWDARREHENAHPAPVVKQAYIDSIWPTTMK